MILATTISSLLLMQAASPAHAFLPLRTVNVPHPLRMSDSKEDESSATFVKSVLKKEIAYDEKSDRFFETGFGEGECIPDEEYCVLDSDTGEMIRLTTEEKERIFLDALQVRREAGCWFCHC